MEKASEVLAEKEQDGQLLRAENQEEGSMNIREKYYWLNEDSRLFLSRGYITESPEQRIKDISRI